MSEAHHILRVIFVPYQNVRFFLTNCIKVENGTCKATVIDSATAEYRVANDFCGLGILPETFRAEQCETQL